MEKQCQLTEFVEFYKKNLNEMDIVRVERAIEMLEKSNSPRVKELYELRDSYSEYIKSQRT